MATEPVDKITRKWVRNRSDELAVKQGCVFDLNRAQHAVDFIERNLTLYEGEYAGEPFILMPYARDAIMRIFGWVRYSERWQRWVRRFRKAALWIPKKNGKSPLAAAVGMYLLVADGENGQKVYTTARDGKQALITHRHAEKMGRSSPRLRNLLKIYKNTHQIEYADTDSYWFLLSGDNINSQEGLNGSCVIDELHVVDGELFSVIEYMGASRSEPLLFMVSTAGKDLQSVGKQIYDYGTSVVRQDKLRGDPEDTAFFHQAYELPETISDEQLKLPADLTEQEIDERLKPWITANPGWGITIDRDEFISSLREAQRSNYKFARFKMYRGNQWQSGTTPWLKAEDWQANYEAWQPNELTGRICYGGIDLALTWDFAALTLLFPMGKTQDDRRLTIYRTITHLFIPEEGFKVIAEHVKNIYDWRDAGHITVTSGNTFDEETFEETVLRCRDKYDLRAIGYDPKFAHSIAQRCQDQHGIEMIKFNQSGVTFAGPIEQFEAAVISGCMRHDGNPAYGWMVANACVRERPGGFKILEKPLKANYKKIDAVVGGVQALGVALSMPDTISIYSEVGALFG